MLGFQAFGRGLLRMASRATMPQFSTFNTKHMGWIHQ